MLENETSDLLIEEHPEGVRLLRLNRPDRLNALTPELVDRITDAITSTEDHRVIVLTGAGRGFCAGVDIAGSHERQQDRTNSDAYLMQERFAAMPLAIHRSPTPVIAAINGPVAGAGLALALACDVRVASPTARFIIGAPNIGLSAGECGISYHLPRIIGMGRAAEIMLTNRHVAAEEAHMIGLVTELARDVEAAALRKAKEIVRLAPFGVKMTKQVYRTTIDSPSLEHALEVENRAQILANGTADAAEARLAFLEKRQPRFSGR